MPVASGLPAGWEWDYDGTRWFYTFTANGHVQYHFPSEGDEFPDFVDVSAPAPDLKPEERLASHQQVKRVTGVAPPSPERARKSGMTATATPVGIEWDGDVGEGNSGSEKGEGGEVFRPEGLMFLGPQTYQDADVSPLNEEEDEAAKRTVVGGVKDGEEGVVVSPAETTSAGTPAAKRAEPVTGDGETIMIESQMVMPAAENEAALAKDKVMEEDVNKIHEAATSLAQQESSATKPTPAQDAKQEKSPAAESATEPQSDAAPAAQDAASIPEPPPVMYELPAPDSPFNPVGIIAEMPTEDTPRSHIEINPIPVEIMDTSVLAPIETAPPYGVAELPAEAAATVKKMPVQQQQPQQARAPVPMLMKIKRKPTDPNAAVLVPSPASSSSAVASPSGASPSVASPSPLSAPATSTPPTLPQYKAYTPVSPLHRADTEPVRVPAAARQPVPSSTQQEKNNATALRAENPQLHYAPTVLRPAGQSRKSSSVSPERKQDRESPAREDTSKVPATDADKQPPTLSTEGRPSNATPSGPAMTPQPDAQNTGVKVARSVSPQGLVQQAQLQHGQVPQQPPRPPMQNGRPPSMVPGQYPPVPIPKPYGQHQQPQPHQTGQPSGHSISPPGQRLGPNYAMPPPQQPSPGLMRQPMPPGQQAPANGRHSMMAQSIPGLIPLGSQYRPAPSPTSPSNQSPVSLGRHRASTDSATAPPLRPRAESQPSGVSLPTSSPVERPQPSSAAQPAVSPLPQETSQTAGLKVDTGSAPGQKRSTSDSYFPPRKEHPVGLTGNIADQFAAEMADIFGSTSEATDTTTAATDVKPEPKTLIGASSPSLGQGLGRIEEQGTGQVPGFPAATNGQPVATPSGPSQPGMTPGSMPPPSQMMPPGARLMPPRGFAPQQQWQGNAQQPAQRPMSLPPQVHMQPEKKEKKWTKWFKSSKSENKLASPQDTPPQQPPSQDWSQPQQGQTGLPMQGHSMQRPQIQGQPMNGLSPQNVPMNAYPPAQLPPGRGQGPMPQMGTQQGPLGSHPSQQYMALQPGQSMGPGPMQTRQTHGVPMQQMQTEGPMMQMQPGQAPPHTMQPQHSNPSQNNTVPSQPTGSPQTPWQGQAAAQIQNNLMPAPLSLRQKP